MNLKEKLKNGMEKTALADYAKYISDIYDEY